MTQALKDHIDATITQLLAKKWSNHISEIIGEPKVENNTVVLTFKNVDGGENEYTYRVQADDSLMLEKEEVRG